MKGTKFEKAVWQRAYRAKNREKVNAASRENYRRNGHKWKNTINIQAKKRNKQIKIDAISRYGGKCYCCGESFYLFLAIDHINGLGNDERRKSGFNGGVAFYRWLKRRGWPDGYQVACHNCNMGRHLNGGICPHQNDDREKELVEDNREIKEIS